MSKGGARTRSGPLADPTSGRSEKRGLASPTALPNEGYTGRVPGLAAFLEKPSARHRAVWNELWRTPQASMWARQKYSWPSVARLAVLRVRGESDDCPATIYSEILKLETKLGLNEEGMRYLGWAMAPDQVAEKRAEKAAAPAAGKSAPVRRLRG